MGGLHLTFMQKYYKKLRGKRNENFSKKGKTMTNTLQKMLLGSALALGLGVTAPAGASQRWFYGSLKRKSASEGGE